MSQPPPLRPFSKKGFALAMCLLVVAAIALLGTAWLALDALLHAIRGSLPQRVTRPRRPRRAIDVRCKSVKKVATAVNSDSRLRLTRTRHCHRG
jgi:hypothetical protein